MPTGEQLPRPQEPKAPGETGGSFKKPGTESGPPPRPARILSPGRVSREGATRAVSPLRVGGGEVARRVLSPNRMAGPDGKERVKIVSPERPETVTLKSMPRPHSDPKKEAASEAWRQRQIAEAEAQGDCVLFSTSGDNSTKLERKSAGSTTPVGELPSVESPDGEADRDVSDLRPELDPVADAAYIRDEKARNTAAKVIEHNQLGENPDPVTLSQYGEALAPGIESTQNYFDGKIAGNPERGVAGKEEAEVLDTVRDLVGDTSNLGLLDGQLNGTTHITRENMGEALILAASADPEGFRERMEAMDLQGADSFVAKSALDIGTAEGLYTLHEQYLLSIGDEEGAARSMNDRMGAGRLDMSPKTVADRDAEREIAEEEDQRLTDEARNVTVNILKNTGKDNDADHPGHQEKVDREGVKVKLAIEQLEHKLLQPVADATSGLDGTDRIDVDTVAVANVLESVHSLVGSTHVDLGNGLEPITRDNMAEAILIAATNDRPGFQDRSEKLDSSDADIAHIALGATSGENMTAYVDDVATSILNYGTTKEIVSGRVDGTIEQVVVSTLSGPKVIDVAVKTTDLTPDGTQAVGWDNEPQKAAYTKILGEPKVVPLSNPDTIDISGGVTGGTVKVSGDGSSVDGPVIPTDVITTGTPRNPEGRVNDTDQTPVAVDTGTDVPTYIDARDPDSVPTVIDHPDVTVVGPTNTGGSPDRGIITTPDGDEIIMPGADPKGEFINGRRDPVETNTGEKTPTSTETQFYVEDDVTVLYNDTTGEGSVTVGDTVYPYKRENQGNGEQRGDMQPPLTDDRDGERGDNTYGDTATVVIDASPVDSGHRGIDEGSSVVIQGEVLAPPVTVELFLGANDASRAAAEELRAEEGDFLASTGDGAASGVIVEGHIGPNIVEAANAEKGGDDASSQSGNDDDAGATATR